MTYANCTAAYNDGRADILIGDPAYAPKLDRDNDGVACEKADAPAGFTPRSQATPSPSTSATVQAQDARLPQTGPGEVTAIGAFVVVMGAVVVVAFRRRRTRFTV